MVWVKVDDRFFQHPKVIQAGIPAAYLYLSGLGYCNGNLTDGFVPDAAVPTLGNFQDVATRASDGQLYETWTGADPTDLAQRLVGVELWEPVLGGYRIHDYLEFQPSREEVLAQQEKLKTGGQRRASAAPRDSRGRFAENGHKTAGQVQPSQPPIQPVPVPEPPKGGRTFAPEPAGSEARARQPDPIWEALEQVYGPAPQRRRFRGAWGTASAELRAQGATPEQIRARVAEGRASDLSWAVVTPSALAKHWNLPLTPAPPRRRVPDDPGARRLREALQERGEEVSVGAVPGDGLGGVARDGLRAGARTIAG